MRCLNIEAELPCQTFYRRPRQLSWPLIIAEEIGEKLNCNAAGSSGFYPHVWESI